MDETMAPDVQQGLTAALAVFSQRARPYSSELDLRLFADRLEAEKGRSLQVYRLAGLKEIQLHYAPRGLRAGYACKITTQEGRILRFSSFSYASLIDLEALDVSYGAFIRVLVEAARKAGKVEIVAGVSPLLSAVRLGVGVIVLTVLTGVAVYMLRFGGMFGAAGAAALAVYGAVWLWRERARNGFARVTEALPRRVVPGGAG